MKNPRPSCARNVLFLDNDPRLLDYNELQKQTYIWVNSYAPVIWNPGPYGAADNGDKAGLKCRDLTSDESRQCRRCAGVLISR